MSRIQVAGAAALALAAAFAGNALAQQQTASPTNPEAPSASTQAGRRPLPPTLAANPAVAEWTGPYGGVPPWDRIKPEHVRTGFDGALAIRDADVRAIVENPAAPSFENTIVALERAGAPYSRLGLIYAVLTNSMNDAEMQKVEAELSPKFAAAADALIQNEALFRRVEAVYNSPDKVKLTPEQQRLVWRTYDGFVRGGAKLAPEQKRRLAAVNQELAGLYADFSRRVLADENTFTVIERQEGLAGLPPAMVGAYKAAADERKLPGKWVVANTRSSVDPFLTFASDRAMREKVWRAFKNRGDNGDANDTNALIAKIMPLRAEKARLLGYPTYADWKLGNKMAKTPDRAMQLMRTVWTPASARVREEVAEMQAIASREGGGVTIEPWDYLYYAEKVRKAKYDLDQNELKPYFELNKMIDASMWMAGRLYGLSFKEITGKAPVFHPDMRVWEVYDGARLIGLFYGDYFARGIKNSGAWEIAYRQQSRYDGERLPLVSNNNNFVKGAPGEPILISLDDTRTLFHEFGHALHDLLSNVTYESLSGTNTATDFTEVPSSVHENWVLTPEILDRFARHHRTGEPMPKALLDKVIAAEKFNQGYATGEAQASAIVDMRLHTLPDGRVDPDAFERQVLAEIGTPKELVMRHRLPHFTHLFADENYAAGYYSYIWSETMAADMWKAFIEAGSPWDPATAAKMKRLMASGDTLDQSDLYRQFRGRDVDVNALLEERGFPAGKVGG
jgi:peptidyl-dipeptidase Dcp